MRSNTSGERDINPTNHCPCPLHRCSLENKCFLSKHRLQSPLATSSQWSQSMPSKLFCDRISVAFLFPSTKSRSFELKEIQIYLHEYIFIRILSSPQLIIYRCNWSSGCDYWSEWQEKSELLTLVSNLSTPLECCFTGSQSHICLNLKSSQTSSSSSSAS